MTKAPGRSSRRRRLGPEQRRAQILAAAAQVFADSPYEHAQIEDVARQAGGISSSLIYHYFPNKQALLSAVVDQYVEAFGDATAPDLTLTPAERLRAALALMIRHVDHHEHQYRAMQRARQSGDAAVRATIDRNERLQIDRIAASWTPDVAPSPALELAIRGAMAFDAAACLGWLEDRPFPADQLLELLTTVFLTAIETARDLPDPENDQADG